MLSKAVTQFLGRQAAPLMEVLCTSSQQEQEGPAVQGGGAAQGRAAEAYVRCPARWVQAWTGA